ncbi:MAG: ABC transporter permease [Candidatus Beckwithbacteria bacterium]|nr:ABC transporter permease [Patescibacteria group bacterium]
MSKARILAVIWRHLYNFKHRADRWVDAFYWPAVDILLWGLTSVYIRDLATDIPNIVTILLTGLVYWQVVWRSNYEIGVNLLEEIWSDNVVNLFASPLTVLEWMVAVNLLGILKMVMTIGFAFSMVFFLYGVNVLQVGWLMIPFVVLLLMNGWWIGFLVAGFIIRFGSKIQTLAWSGVYLLAPFSAIYYPVSSLPEWVQKVAAWAPLSYVFEGMRSVLFTGVMDQANLFKSGWLTGVYLMASMVFFVIMFKQSKKVGLSSLE